MKTLTELKKMSPEIPLYDLEVELGPDEKIKMGDVFQKGKTKLLVSGLVQKENKAILKMYHMNAASGPMEKIPAGTEIIFTNTLEDEPKEKPADDKE